MVLSVIKEVHRTVNARLVEARQVAHSFEHTFNELAKDACLVASKDASSLCEVLVASLGAPDEAAPRYSATRQRQKIQSILMSYHKSDDDAIVGFYAVCDASSTTACERGIIAQRSRLRILEEARKLEETRRIAEKAQLVTQREQLVKEMFELLGVLFNETRLKRGSETQSLGRAGCLEALRAFIKARKLKVDEKVLRDEWSAAIKRQGKLPTQQVDRDEFMRVFVAAPGIPCMQLSNDQRRIMLQLCASPSEQ